MPPYTHQRSYSSNQQSNNQAAQWNVPNQGVNVFIRHPSQRSVCVKPYIQASKPSSARQIAPWEHNGPLDPCILKPMPAHQWQKAPPKQTRYSSTNAPPQSTGNLNPHIIAQKEEERQQREREAAWLRVNEQARLMNVDAPLPPRRPLSETVASWKRKKELKDPEANAKAAQASASNRPARNEPKPQAVSDPRLKNHVFFKDVLNF